MKYKVWNKKTKKMMQGKIILYLGTNVATYKKRVKGVLVKKEISLDDVEVLWHIGWSDCNGKDIYLGDIIEMYSDYDDCVGVVVKYNGTYYCEVMIDGVKHIKRLLGEIYVLGNIYENKELLEKE